MATKSVLFTSRAATLDVTHVDIHAMHNDDGHDDPAIALSFHTGRAGGLGCGFHADVREMREFAAQLIRHCDAADQAHAEVTQRAAA